MLQVFIAPQTVASADVALHHLCPGAAFKAHHIISIYGSPDWHGRGPRLFGLWRFSKLTDRVMH